MSWLESTDLSAHSCGVRFIRDIITEKKAAGRPVFSVEFFPPKTEEGDRNLIDKTVPALLAAKPDYCSVTYGAGGSTRDKTLNIVDQIQKRHGLTAMAHLTCVNATSEQLAGVIEQARELGIANILALRGDPPGGNGEFQKAAGGFEYSHELVTFLKKLGGFCVGTAGFPEGHIACKEGKFVDWQRLKHKVDCGADFVITQLFFDNADFFEFRDHMRAIGLRVPILAGIIPIMSVAQIRRFTTMCGSRIPESLAVQLDALGADDAAAAEFGIEFATQQCRDLMAKGVDGIHFYTLNKASSTARILSNLASTP